MEQLTDEQRENLSFFKVHKIKNPKEYGGWSHWMSAWCLIPIIGLIIGIMGIVSDNELKKVQGKVLLVSSLILGIFGVLQTIN